MFITLGRAISVKEWGWKPDCNGLKRLAKNIKTTTDNSRLCMGLANRVAALGESHGESFCYAFIFWIKNTRTGLERYNKRVRIITQEIKGLGQSQKYKIVQNPLIRINFRWEWGVLLHCYERILLCCSSVTFLQL